jgi:hypothetical protein
MAIGILVEPELIALILIETDGTKYPNPTPRSIARNIQSVK